MLFVGDDWAEDHHDVEVVDETGRTLARRRFPEGLEGITRLHALIGEHLPVPSGPGEPVAEVVVGIETERGPWAAALVAAGAKVVFVRRIHSKLLVADGSVLCVGSFNWLSAAGRGRLRILVKLATNNASKLAGDNASTCPLQKELQAES